MPSIFVPEFTSKLVKSVASAKNGLTEEALVNALIIRAGDLVPEPCQKRSYARYRLELSDQAETVARRVDGDLRILNRYYTTHALTLGAASVKAVCQAKTGRTNRNDIIEYLGEALE